MVDKIPENQLKAINQAKADGISAEERKALEMQGVNEELLEKLSGTKSAEEVDKAVDAYLKEQQDSPSFWKHPIDWFKSDKVSTGEKILAGVGIAGAAALGGWGVFAALGTKGLLAAGAVVVAGGLTSCSSDLDEPTVIVPSNNTNIYNNITINVTNESRDDEILAEIKKLREEQKASNAAILEALLAAGISLNRIMDLLSKMNMTVEDMQTTINNIAGDNENIKATLTTIMNYVKDGNKLTEEGNKLLTEILEKLKGYEASQADVKAILEKMLYKLEEIIAKGDSATEAEKARDEKVQILLQTILENMQAFNADFKGGVAAILEVLDGMSNVQLEMLEAVYKLYDKLGAEAKNIINAIMNGQKVTVEQLNEIINNQKLQNEDLESLKELIMKNNEIAQGTQDAVKDMSANMTEEHKAILEAIKNVQAGGGDYGDLKAILEQIAQNTSLLPDINKQLCLIGSAIEKILDEVKGLRAETQKGLLAILAKIPDGCNCQTVDISGILAKLDEILAELKKDPADNNEDTNHEGIIKDLEDYFS